MSPLCILAELVGRVFIYTLNYVVVVSAHFAPSTRAKSPFITATCGHVCIGVLELFSGYFPSRPVAIKARDKIEDWQ